MRSPPPDHGSSVADGSAMSSSGSHATLSDGGRWIRTIGSAREEIEKSWYPVGVQLILYGFARPRDRWFADSPPGSRPARQITAQAGRTTVAIAATRSRSFPADQKKLWSCCCRSPGASERVAGSGWRSPAPTSTITVRCRMAARPSSPLVGLTHFSIRPARPRRRRSIAATFDETGACGPPARGHARR